MHTPERGIVIADRMTSPPQPSGAAGTARYVVSGDAHGSENHERSRCLDAAPTTARVRIRALE